MSVRIPVHDMYSYFFLQRRLAPRSTVDLGAMSAREGERKRAPIAPIPLLMVHGESWFWSFKCPQGTCDIIAHSQLETRAENSNSNNALQTGGGEQQQQRLRHINTAAAEYQCEDGTGMKKTLFIREKYE